MTQITFPFDEAHKALGEFLSGDADGMGHDDRRIGRSIASPDGNGTAASIVDPVYLSELRTAAEAWREHMQPKDDYDQGAYMPYLHAPTAREDRLLPVDELADTIARHYHGKPYDELDRDEQTKARSAALVGILTLTLDPDDTGAVPILMLAHGAEDRDAPQSRMLWQLAYKTEVPGLFVRVTANGFFGEEFGIVTGSGLKLASGWYEREFVDKAVAAIGRVLPQVNWMDVKDAGVFPPAALDALKAVFRRYRSDREDESVPLPEPVQADNSEPTPVTPV